MLFQDGHALQSIVWPVYLCAHEVRILGSEALQRCRQAQFEKQKQSLKPQERLRGDIDSAQSLMEMLPNYLHSVLSVSLRHVIISMVHTLRACTGCEYISHATC